MKDFLDYLQEAAKKPKPIVLEAERLCMEAKGQEANRLKAAKAIPPITVCDLFSDSTPKRLYQLMEEDLWFQTLVSNGIISSRGYSYDYDEPAWMERLKRDVWSPFVEWFEAEGGSKQGMIPKIAAMASCRKRAAWANWSGTAYRGLSRSLARVAKYEYTDKTVVIEGRTWLVASVSYQSKYAIQSWTSVPKVAKNFADGDMNDVAVILQMDIKKGEGFLSPEVSNRLARNYKESEVLRIGNAKTKVKAYIEVKRLVNSMLDIVANTRVPSWWHTDDLSSDQKKKEWIQITSQKLNRLGFSKQSIENMTKPSHPFVKEMLKGRWG